MKGRLLSFISLGLTGTVLALGGCESLANAKKKGLPLPSQEGPQSYAPRPGLQPKEELQVYVPRLASQEISPLLLRAGFNGEARPVRAMSLEAILEELKLDLIRHRYGQLVERVDEQLFPYRQLEQKLGELTGISFRDKPLPRLKVHRFNEEGEAWDGPEEVAALYRREENTIYFDPSILVEREKEAIYHEFFHSKGHFVSAELNEGWVEYLTVLATGLPPARYGMRAFNVHNLVFLLGQLSARAEQDPYGRALERPGVGPGELNPSEVQRRGRLLMAQAFHGGSLARLIGWLNRQEPSLGERLLGEPFAAEDGLESFRLVLALEEGLKARGYGLQEWPQAELLLANFGFISLPPELYPSTLAFCEKALQARPASVLVPHLWIVVGNLYRKQGIHLKARESYEKALAGLGEGRFPRELVQLELVGSYRSLGLLSEALAVLEELCRSQQSFLRAKACSLRVEIYAQQGKYAQALEELYRLRRQPLGPDGSWYLASSYLEAARLLRRQKSYPQALTELSEGIRRFPHAVMAVEARLRMGEIYEEMRRYEQARDTYLGLIQERPQFHWANQARFRLAHLYLKVYQDRQAALRYFREVIRQAPLSKEAESSRKICQELESQPKTSRKFLREIASSLLG